VSGDIHHEIKLVATGQLIKDLIGERLAQVFVFCDSWTEEKPAVDATESRMARWIDITQDCAIALFLAVVAEGIGIGRDYVSGDFIRIQQRLVGNGPHVRLARNRPKSSLRPWLTPMDRRMMSKRAKKRVKVFRQEKGWICQPPGQRRHVILCET
jgi:hypothetical protein